MRPFIPSDRVNAVFAAAAISAALLLGTFTHIVSQATQAGAERYKPGAGTAATKATAPRKTANAGRT